MLKLFHFHRAKRSGDEKQTPVKTKVATKDSWNIEPMPDKHVIIPIDETIPSAAMRTVKQGHIPEAMEDHWFMYCDDTTIRYYRSWSGFCIYIAKYSDDGTNCKITELTINRDPDQYSNTDDREDVETFLALLTADSSANTTVI